MPRPRVKALVSERDITMTVATKIPVAKFPPLASNWNN
jgi:hypothetical protein